jgi:MutS domain V
MEWWRKRQVLARVRLDWGRLHERSRDLAAIASYHVAVTADAPGDSLDQRTWNDLDLDEVFAALDRTGSSVGQQCLYHRLRSRSGATTLDAFESLVQVMSSDAQLRERCQVALSLLAGTSGYQVWTLARPGALDVRPWHALFPIVATSVVVLTLLAFAWPQLILTLALIGPACLVMRLATAKRIGRVVEPFRYIGPLIATASTLRTLLEVGDEPLTGALRIDLPHLSRLRLLSGWLTRDSIGMDPLSGALFELLNSFLLLDANAVLLGARELRRYGPALQRVLAAVGEIDAAIAVASYRAGTPSWTRPVPQSSGRPITIRDLRHPLLPDGVPNSIDLAPPHGVLITGSNMSGKSTFLRSLGLAAVLSRTINTCTASTYEAPLLVVRSCIGRSDNIVEGRSYYLDEVRGVLGVLQASQSADTHLFLFDELFRGTNAVERIAASEATLRELADTSHVVVTATHDMEVVSLLRGRFTPFHFADRMGSEGLLFDYRLTEGPSTTRNAIALLEFNGAPPSLVARARQRAAELDAHADLGPGT